MNTGRTVFAQLLDLLPRHEFRRCVDRYRGNRRVRELSCFDQFLCLAFAQLTGRESLRDIETCLGALGPKLYHAGFRGRVARSTLADANESRDWHLYADLAQVLIARARRLYAGADGGLDLNETVYAFDSTTIDLCLSLFPWARFRRRKGAIKLHTQLDLRGSIPTFVHLSDGKTADVVVLDELVLEPGAYYVFDRGYTDFARLYRFTEEMAYFITRSKAGLDFVRLRSAPVDKSTGLRSDQTIRLCGPKSAKRYPAPLRHIHYVDLEADKRLRFLTNNFRLPALTAAALYHHRWRVELFFKWIKQHLRIKAFYGTSANAVHIQVWVALCVYLLVAIARRELGLARSPFEILQILSISLFERLPIREVLAAPIGQTAPAEPQNRDGTCHKQLSLFNI